MHWHKQSRVYLDKEKQQGNVQKKPCRQILAHSRIFRNIQTHSGIIQACSELRLRHIPNHGIIRTLANSESEAYQEPCQISKMERFASV